MKELFLISSSRYQGGGFWAHCIDALKNFLGEPEIGRNRIVFVPYANVDGDYKGYTKIISEILNPFGYEVVGIHELLGSITLHHRPYELSEDNTICAICIGGGNTWVLNSTLQSLHVLSLINQKVISGSWKYFGASAGTVTACPSFLTTNDMAPVLPKSDLALNLVPFQINPHFVPGSLVPGHMGETREERIRQVILHNPKWQVVGLPEGCWIEGKGEEYVLCGTGEAGIFRKNGNNSIWLPGEEFDPIGML